MPPIEIPTVRRIDPSPDASVGRLDVRLPDATKDLQSTQSALVGVADQAIKYRNQVADQHADTVATDAANRFEQRWKTEMYGDPESGKIGVKFQDGNPTDLYKKFDDTMQSHLTELSSNDQWDTETQNLVNRRLGKKAEELRLQTLTDYGSQQHKYDDGITETNVKLNQDGMAPATSLIEPESITKGDTSTLDPVKDRITAIQAARIHQGLRYGGVTIDDKNGQTPYTDPATGEKHFVTLGPQTQLKIKQDLSKALYDATDNLVKSGEDDPAILAKAQIMKDQFGQYIEPLKQGGLNAAFNKAHVKNEANDLVAQAEGKSPDQAEQIFANATDQETKTKARQIFADNLRYQESARHNQQELNYRALYKQAAALKQSDPSMTESQFESTPQYKFLADKMDPKDIPSIKAVFNPPKESSVEATARVARILRGDDPQNDPRTMTDDQINKALQGLNGPDREAAMKRMTGANSQTESQQFQQNQRAMVELKAQALRQGRIVVDNDMRTDLAKGGKNDVLLGELQSRLTPIIEKMGPMTPAEMRSTVNQFLIDDKAGKVYEPPKRFQAHGPAFGAQANADPTKKTAPLTQAQINGKAIKDYTNQNGRAPNKNELSTYIEENKARYK